LWQTYLWWEELMLMRQRHNLRISAAERGKSNMDAELERSYMRVLGILEGKGGNDENYKMLTKEMHKAGREAARFGIGSSASGASAAI